MFNSSDFLKPVYVPGFVISICLLLTFCDDQVTDPGDDPADPDNGNDNAVIPFHRDAPGQSATAFLSDEDFSSLHLEIQYMEGHEPQTESLEDALLDFLSDRLHKDEITISFEAVPAGNQEVYTSADVRELEEEHRSHYNEEEGTELNAYLLFLDGEYENSSVLGIAYWNTSMAIF